MTLLKRRAGCLMAAALTILVLLAAAGAHSTATDYALPGSEQPDRQLLRIWVVSSPGGGMSWLRAQLAAFEKQNPGVMTYVRQVSAQDCMTAEVKPDVILHMPGDFTAPEALLLPLAGGMDVSEALLRCGRWKGAQYGLPLCWAGWALAIDSAMDDVPAVTPAPTTLLGKPAATESASATPTPGYPVDKASHADTALLAPGGAGLFALTQLLPPDQRPVLDASFLMDSPADTYQAFLSKKCASALLTTGQLVAFESLQRAGKGFAVRILTPQEIITDQVWLAGLARDTDTGRRFLAALISEDAQRALTAQGLYGALLERVMYTGGTGALIEAAARRGFTALNAYIGPENAATSAWQAFFGQVTLNEALLPLI